MSKTWNRPMLVFSCACAALVVVAALGMLVDDRVLGGAPIWAKPLKFAVSGTVYGLTWAWLSSLITVRQRTVRRASAVIVILLSIELVLIIGQVIRGKRSHFNFETPFDAVLYEVMAVSIAAVWGGALVLTVLVLRSDIRDRPLKLTVGAGSVLSLIGIGLGALMTLPTSAQLGAIEAGQGFHSLGAHTVGAREGGPGLPLLGWSTTGGDLRIPHFVGMHALQALMVLCLVLTVLARRWPRLRSATVRSRLVCVGATAFAGLLALLTWQAYRGQPLTSPDRWTLVALGVLAIELVIATAIALRREPVASAEVIPIPTAPREHADVA